MAYSVQGDVERLLGTTFSASTVPTATEVSTNIDRYDAEIDAELKRQGYDPDTITDADSLLGELSALGAAFKTARALYAGSSFNDSPVIGSIEEERDRMWSMLRDDANLLLNTSGDTVEYSDSTPTSTTVPGKHFNLDQQY